MPSDSHMSKRNLFALYFAGLCAMEFHPRNCSTEPNGVRIRRCAILANGMIEHSYMVFDSWKTQTEIEEEEICLGS